MFEERKKNVSNMTKRAVFIRIMGLMGLSNDRIGNSLHFKKAVSIQTNQIKPADMAFAGYNKEVITNEIEAELKRAQARTCASAILIR